MVLPPLTPGSTSQWKLIPSPAGIATDISLIGWAAESSDGNTDVSMVSNPDDASGMAATLTLDAAIAPGAIISFWAVYRNPSGTETTGGPWDQLVVSG